MVALNMPLTQTSTLPKVPLPALNPLPTALPSLIIRTELSLQGPVYVNVCIHYEHLVYATQSQHIPTCQLHDHTLTQTCYSSILKMAAAMNSNPSVSAVG